MRCRVPTTFSPSQLAFGAECLLRAVLASTRELPTLTTHPAAAVGRVFHALLEMAVRGEIPRSDMPGDDAARTLDRLLDAEDARLAATWGAVAAGGGARSKGPPRLREVFPPLIWRRKRRVALDLAETYLLGAVPRAAGGGTVARSAKDLPAEGSWAEVQIEAPTLRLRGRADLVERRGGEVVIRDLKTGRILTDAGDVLPHIQRQMRLYGLMARAVWPVARVSLIVDHGVEHEVGFSAEHEAEVLVWLRGVLRRLPGEETVDAASLATPGAACEACAHRHICPAYLSAAPEYWRGESPVRLPLDTWGEVLRVATRTDGLADLTIRDAAGRVVKVFGLATFRVSSMRAGKAVWLFGLRTRDRRGGPERWRHPRNFFEVADDDAFGSAWTVESFA